MCDIFVVNLTGTYRCVVGFRDQAVIAPGVYLEHWRALGVDPIGER